MTKGKLATWIGIAAGAATIVVAMFTLWGSIGWTTPNQHNADFLTAVGDVKDFRDEWKCDEYDEELLDARERLIRAEANGEDTVEIEHLIEKIKEKMEKLDCSRFEDFG